MNISPSDRASSDKAELDAIALHLTMSVLPGLKKAAEQARLIPGIASHLESMSDGIGELLMTLRAA